MKDGMNRLGRAIFHSVEKSLKKFPYRGKPLARKDTIFHGVENSIGDFPQCGKSGAPGFSLTELLVVVAIGGVMAAVLMPALLYAKRIAERSACQNNLRQLVTANINYAAEYHFFVAAAEDIFGNNSVRWHGKRAGGRFDGEEGPLAPYLGGTTGSRLIRRCPSFRPKEDGFEASCGGYGYNDRGVGSQVYTTGATDRGMPPTAFRNPANTVMFTDTAFLRGGSLIEYSFCEAPLFVYQGHEGGSATPSIHFRHVGDSVNVAWCDGHVSVEVMSFSRGASTAQKIGWFGPADNSMFSPH